MSSRGAELRQRTKDFAIRVIRLCRALPAGREGRMIGDQLFRSATAVAANYRAACRGRSRAEFAAKLGTVLEEADETQWWIELLGDIGLFPRARLASLLEEADELVAIFTSSVSTARGKRSSPQPFDPTPSG